MPGDFSAPVSAPVTPHPTPPPPPVPKAVGLLLEPLYRRVIQGRNRRFDAGRGVTRLDVPVISIGNLSVGGTGKSPMVAHVIGLLLRAGQRPCIAMRGYKKRSDRALPGPSDEADSHRRLFPGVPVVAQPDRLSGLRALFDAAPAAERPTCVVLDDGFQHRRIARDMDVVLIDASRPPFDDRLLPAGWQREPTSSLARATHVVLTHSELADTAAIDRLDRLVAESRGKPSLVADAVTRHAWTGLSITRRDGEKPGTDEQVLPLDWLLGKRVVASCAIGNPEGFLLSLRRTINEDYHRQGLLAGTLVLPDHDPYRPATVEALRHLAEEHRADAIVVTDKDWSKLRHVDRALWNGRAVVRPRLSLAFDRGGEMFDDAILSVCRRPGTLGRRPANA